MSKNSEGSGMGAVGVTVMSLEELIQEVTRLELEYNSDTSNQTTLEALSKAYNKLGLVKCVFNKEFEAISILEKAIKLPQNPKTAEVVKTLAAAYNKLGFNFLEQSKFEEAIEILEKAIKLPQNINTNAVVENLAAAYNDLGAKCFHNQEFEEAIELFEKAYALPQNLHTNRIVQNLAAAYNKLGFNFLEQSKFEEAIEILEKAIKLPQNINTNAVVKSLAAAYNELGVKFLGQENFEEAIEILEKAIKLPQNINTNEFVQNLSVAYNELGTQYFRNKKFEEAIELFEKAYALPQNPNTNLVVKSLSEAYEVSCRYKESIALLEKHYLGKEVDALISSIIEVLYFIMLQHNKSDAISVAGNILSKAEVSSDLGLIYKKILVSYHHHLGGELAEAIVNSCKKGKYSKVESHIAILSEYISGEGVSAEYVAVLSKQLSYLNLYLARHSGDLSYLENVDVGLFSNEEVRECDEIMADIYFETSKLCKNDGDFGKAIEYFEKLKVLDPNREGLTDFAKSLYLGAARKSKESDSEKAFEYFKKAKELDKTLMLDAGNKDLAYDISISLSKELLVIDTESSVKQAICYLQNAEKCKKSVDIYKLKMEAYLKLAYGAKESLYLKKVTEELKVMESFARVETSVIELYVVKISARYLRMSEREDVDEQTKLALKEEAQRVIDSVKYLNKSPKEALLELCKDEPRFTSVCDQVKIIFGFTQDEYKEIAEELLSFVPEALYVGWSKSKGSTELTEVKKRSQESLKHDELQVHKRFLKLCEEAEKKFDASENDHSREAMLTWKIGGATYKWDGYTSYAEKDKAVYQVSPNLYAMIDPSLRTEYLSKFTAALQHGMAAKEFSSKGIKEIGNGGFELKILGDKGAGDARLVASKIYECKRDKAEVGGDAMSPAVSKSGSSASSSPQKSKATKSAPKSPPSSSDESSLSGEECSPDIIKLIIFDTLANHECIERGIGLTPEICSMLLGDNGWCEEE